MKQIMVAELTVGTVYVDSMWSSKAGKWVPDGDRRTRVETLEQHGVGFLHVNDRLCYDVEAVLFRA